jgi:hypothetical protein
MFALVSGLLLVPVVDQALKLLLRRWLGAGSIALGPWGSVRLVPAQVWLTRTPRRLGPGVLWIFWLLSAALLTILVGAVPACCPFAGLLLGGSFSHALETSQRGHISDYVCLRFWPAFNLADVAITVGAAGLAGNLLLLPLWLSKA